MKKVLLVLFLLGLALLEYVYYFSVHAPSPASADVTPEAVRAPPQQHPHGH